MVERVTVNHHVPGSSPGRGAFLCSFSNAPYGIPEENIDKLLLGLNGIAVISIVVFCVCLKTLPEQHRSYIDGLLLVAVAVASGGPFLKNHLLLRKAPSPRPKIIFPLLSLLVGINLFCLVVMYKDQLNFSRGFGLILCIGIYLFVFLPLWVIFLWQLQNSPA